jgi:hypothetical protein
VNGNLSFQKEFLGLKSGMGKPGKSIEIGVVVLRGPTLFLVTRKFARQSHAAVGASRNATFYGLCRGVRLGSIPIARSTLRLFQTTLDRSPGQKSLVAWEDCGILRRFLNSFAVLDVLGRPSIRTQRRTRGRFSKKRGPALTLR